MIVIFVLLPLALLFTVGFIGVFAWATRDGQFDDTETPQLRVLFDEEGGADAAKGEGRQA